MAESFTKIAVGAAAAVCLAGYAAFCAYSIWNGDVNIALDCRTMRVTSPESPWWEKSVWVFSLSKGPGKENIRRDLQYVADHEDILKEGEEKFTRICLSCSAKNSEIVVKKD